MADDNGKEPGDNRRTGKDRRQSPPDRRQRQELFNSGDAKFYDRRSGWQRRKGPRRRNDESHEEW